MRVSIPLVVLFCLPLALWSQDVSRNTLYVEAEATGLNYSVNYDRLLTGQNNVNYHYRIGLSLFPDLHEEHLSRTFVALPMSFGILKNIHNNGYLELSLFATTLIGEDEDWGDAPKDSSLQEPMMVRTVFLIPGMSIGYRVQPTLNGLFFTTRFQVFPYRQGLFNPYFSIGVGWAFR